MNTSIKIVAIIIILVVVGFSFKLINDSHEPLVTETPTEIEDENNFDPNKEPVIEPTYVNASADLIQVELPYPGAVTGKEFTIIGKARGYWFFEASFPVELRSMDGNILGGGVATAEGDWMTEDFVNFTAEMQTPSAFTGPAILILKKDNPSGLPENDASISFPINVQF
jgi:hypothetical protein